MGPSSLARRLAAWQVPPPTHPDQFLAAASWTLAATLAAFPCFTQFGMMLSLTAGRTAIALVAPLSLLASLFFADWIARRMALPRPLRLRAAAISLSVIALSVAVSSWYFDLSWDGQWYHQTAIYSIARDWNPLTDPMRPFVSHLELFVRHYAKGPWYFAAAIYRTTGLIEAGKCINLIACAAMALAVFAAGLDFGLRRRQAAAIALVVALNPVVASEWTTYLVDGVLIAYLLAAVAATLSAIHRPNPAAVWVAMLAAIVCINAKLSGAVFVCLLAFGVWLWCALRRREMIWRYTAVAAAALFLAVAVFGYNPYVTNTIYRHHPFYPVAGTAAWPSLTQQGKEGIERYETPKNLLGHSRFYRLFYATFGRPGNAPYINQKNAELMWPFTARLQDLVYYRYHETRVAGFGPFFSGAVLLALALWLWLLLRSGASPWPMLLVSATLAASLLFSPHLWWARYGPQMWLVPLAPIPFAFLSRRPGRIVPVAWSLLALLVINAAIVAGVRFEWETRSSLALRRQLQELRQPGNQVAISMGWFSFPIGERLKTWGVQFHRAKASDLKNADVMVSVVDGYPGAVHFRVVKDSVTP